MWSKKVWWQESLFNFYWNFTQLIHSPCHNNNFLKSKSVNIHCYIPSVLSRMDDVSERFSIMAAEGCEEMSGNGELEESSGSLINV